MIHTFGDDPYIYDPWIWGSLVQQRNSWRVAGWELGNAAPLVPLFPAGKTGADFKVWFSKMLKFFPFPLRNFQDFCGFPFLSMDFICYKW